MIYISKCPYRISLLGGSSDLDWFVSENKIGLSFGFSINRYSRVVAGFRNPFIDKGILNYSSREEYADVDDISHPLIRTTLKKLNIYKPIELASFGDIFSGTGLASSASFTIALIKVLNKLNNLDKSNFEIAKIACDIEINDLGTKSGRQDQYLCALGGINMLQFKPNKVVEIHNSKKYEDEDN